MTIPERPEVKPPIPRPKPHNRCPWCEACIECGQKHKDSCPKSEAQW